MARRVSGWRLAVTALAVVTAATAVNPSVLGDVGLRPNLDAVVSGNNQFAFDLYATLADKEDGNLFFSPYSVSTALAMTYAGARGNTATQMAETLHFTLPQADLHPAFGDLIGDLNGRQQDAYQLNTANRLWGQEGYHFVPDFLDVTRESYGAELTRLDFARQTETARLTINQWVEDQTQEKIKDLLVPGVLTEMTRLVLTNAIYFKSDWKHPFDPERTNDAPFWKTPDEQVTVSMMHQVGKLNYAALPSAKILELPYTNDDLSMLLLLPNERGGLAELETQLTAETLNQFIDQMVPKDVSVSMPKFGMTRDVNLSLVLKSMGMPEAFDPGIADFSGMTGDRDLYISDVVHKAFISLDEEGTEAAAATAVVMSGRSGGPRIEEFDADHPFLFFIRDNHTQSVLFMGRAADLSPGAKGVVVPEPATVILVGLAGVMVAMRRRRP